MFNKKIALYFNLVFFIGVASLLIANWWYFDFYKDFISIRTFSLFKYSSETSLNLSAFSFVKDSSYLLLSTIVLIFLHHYFFSKKLTYLYIVLAVIAITLFAVKESKVVSIYGGGHTLRYKHPIVYLLREPFEKKGIDKITEKHISAVSKIFKKTVKTNNNKTLANLVKKHDFNPSPNDYNVIILNLESFRANEVGSYNPEKIHLTPNFDKLANESTLYKNMYANSYQTPRGELAILCSMMDFISGAPFSESAYKSPTECLPHILSSKGYATHWFHGYNTEFFNRKMFLPKIGIQSIHDKSEIEKKAIHKPIGWGVADIDTFTYTVSVLEKETKPFIAEVMSLSNHYPFNWDWGVSIPDKIKIKEGESIYDAYQRGIYYTDFALGIFLDKFKKSKLHENTILIVTADHGLWLSPESDNAITVESLIKKIDQYFRIPLLIHLPDQRTPFVKNKVATQFDIAPTILELLNIDYSTAFLGNSLLSAKTNNSVALMYGAGTYHYRKNNTLCYNVDNIDNKKHCGVENKNSAYKRCNKLVYDISKSSCFNIKGDALIPNSLKILGKTNNLYSDDLLKKVVEFTEYSLQYGLNNSFPRLKNVSNQK
jgi:phosphoglycerol transferase MdoB-like AlkP superfamily enzyme